MDIVQATILASPTLKSDFGGCVTVYKDFTKKSLETKLNQIAAVGICNIGGEGRLVKVEDHYYC